MARVIKEKYVDAGGIETHYWEAGAGRPIVLIHGGGPGVDSWGNWQYVIHLLLNQGYRILAPDLVGFAKSEAPEPDVFEYSGDHVRQHVIDFIETLELDLPTLVGQSFGGSVCMGIAIERPDLLDKLVLLGPSGRYIHESDTGNGGSRELDLARMKNVARSMSATGNIDFEEVAERRLEMWGQTGVPEAFEAIQRAVNNGEFAYTDAALGEIPHDTLIFQGMDDELLDPEYSWHYTNCIPNATLHTITDAGHWEMIDQADEVAHLINRFVRK